MKIAFTRDFDKAAGKIKDKKLATDLLNIINNVKLATNIFQITNLKNLKVIQAHTEFGLEIIV